MGALELYCEHRSPLDVRTETEKRLGVSFACGAFPDEDRKRYCGMENQDEINMCPDRL